MSENTVTTRRSAALLQEYREGRQVEPEPRFVTIPVVIDCPAWCTADHEGARGLDDVWHTRVLAAVDEDTDVRLVLSEVARVHLGYDLPPDVNVNMGGNAVEFELAGGRRDNVLEVEQFRVLADLVARAAAALPEAGMGAGR